MVIKSRAIFNTGNSFRDNATWEGLQKCYWKADSQFCLCVRVTSEKEPVDESSLPPPHQERFYAEKSLHYLISPAFLWFLWMNFSSRRKREDKKAAVCTMVGVASGAHVGRQVWVSQCLSTTATSLTTYSVILQEMLVSATSPWTLENGNPAWDSVL